MSDARCHFSNVKRWLRRGVLAARAGDHDVARESFHLVLEQDPENIDALLWLARLTPDRQESLMLLSRVLELDPDNEIALAGMRWARKHPDAGTITLKLPAETPEVETGQRLILPILRSGLQRLLFGIGTLLLIGYLVFLGLAMAEKAQAGSSSDFLSTAWQAWGSLVAYVSQRLFGPAETYTWHRLQIPVGEFVWMLLRRSAVLLLGSLAVASAGGMTLGIIAARSRKAFIKTLLPFLTILTISLPSFLIGMILWMINLAVHRRFNVSVLPPTGYGLDVHMIMPVLVLAARPLAQITRVTYATFGDIFQQDYVRTATAKGLRPHYILNKHILRNGLVPVLTTMVSGLRLSLSSLPVVEFFFVWPGLGLGLLSAIEEGNGHLTADLVLTLGFIFILGNMLLEMAYPVIDPRIAQGQSTIHRLGPSMTLFDRLKDWWQILRAGWLRWKQRLSLGKLTGSFLPIQGGRPRATSRDSARIVEDREQRSYQRRTRIRAVFTNLPFVLGTILVLGFFFIALLGDDLAPANPFRTSGVRYENGELMAPPFPPALAPPSGFFDVLGLARYFNGVLFPQEISFPWGSDPVGRDMMSLVLVGAKRTLALGLFATLARLLIGIGLGCLAGWTRGSRIDRFLGGLADILQAFPTLLFAMVLILALDVRKGMAPFIIALAVVGWGEVMQLTRSKVIHLKNLPFVESALATGSSSSQLFMRHLVPNMLSTIIPLAALEMAGVMLLVAELGFLNIFLGGGAQAEVFSESMYDASKYHYSDVPEWGALLSNVRDWWRSYPWMAWYPGLFFAGVILAFNVWGEGLQRLLEDVGFGLSRLFNRYTLAVGAVLVLGLVWTMRSTAPLGIYTSQSRLFNARNTMADVAYLSSTEMQGREPGSAGYENAAEYIADRMKQIGLQPAGNSDTYFQVLQEQVFHLTEVPGLSLVGPDGTVLEEFTYREDYVEVATPYRNDGLARGRVLLTLLGPPAETGAVERFHLDTDQTADSILLLTSLESLDKIQDVPRKGVLVVVDDPAWFKRRYLLSPTPDYDRPSSPTLAITPRLAERLLGNTKMSVDQLRLRESTLSANESEALPLEVTTSLSIVGEVTVEDHVNVIGFLPGGRAMEGLDDQVILVSAYYDGLGVGPDGVLYPGANDNASGVATMLEIARAWSEAPYQPRKTILFVAWTGGEQHKSLSVFEIMNAKIGFATNMQVEAVIELSSVGQGEDEAILIAEGSSYRLTRLFRSAGNRLGVPTTIRGKHPHSDTYQLGAKGDLSALVARICWAGSDVTAHTPLDTIETIDLSKIEHVGQTVFLAATVMGREVGY